MKIEMTQVEFNDFIHNQQARLADQARIAAERTTQIQNLQNDLRKANDKVYTAENKVHTAENKVHDKDYEISRLTDQIRVEKLNTENAKAAPADPHLTAKVLQDLLVAIATGNKIEGIKHIRTLTGYGLKEAKDLYESGFEKKKLAA